MPVEAHRHAAEVLEPGAQPLDLPAAAASILAVRRLGDKLRVDCSLLVG